tara:strand:+ start:252 stop:866 length:615 start_codon:yes stop_codon:yes gene_type:complete
MEIKICGISDFDTLNFVIHHPNYPMYIGFIVNYKKSKRFVDFNKLAKFFQIKKKETNFVAVLVKPTLSELEKFTKLPFDYFQIYDLTPKEIELIKKKYKIKIIVALTIQNKLDVIKYKDYEKVADIFLFDGKGYEKSISFDHTLLKGISFKKKIMLAGNIQIDEELNKFKKIVNIIDISGGLETSGIKDISKIDFFLNRINNET